MNFGPYTTSIGPYYHTTFNSDGTRDVEGGFIFPTVPIIVVALLMFVAYKYGKRKA